MPNMSTLFVSEVTSSNPAFARFFSAMQTWINMDKHLSTKGPCTKYFIYRESTNEALAYRPEMTRFGGPPERSEGGEGHRMGPLRAHGEHVTLFGCRVR